MVQSTIRETGVKISIKLPTINYCPVCNTYIEPIILHNITTSAYYFFNPDLCKTSVLYLCPHCHEVFMCKMKTMRDPISSNIVQYIGSEPEYFPRNTFEQKFHDSITSISPKFIEIYNQSYAAEQQGLFEICGMGYRKSLEFLIKDFLISNTPTDKDEIEAKPLSQCIKDLSNDYPKLSTVAERATWLGNDEAHYIRKHLDYDLNTLKALINATVAYIQLESITKAALNIERKK